MAIMGIDASSLLGSRQIAGVQVQHMGQFRRDAGAGSAGVVGAGALATEIGVTIASGRSTAYPRRHRSSNGGTCTWRLRTRSLHSSVTRAVRPRRRVA